MSRPDGLANRIARSLVSFVFADMNLLARWLAPLMLAGTSLTSGVFLANWVVARWDLHYQPYRGRLNDTERIPRREFSVTVTTNALGFREPRLPGPKPEGTVRIVTLGDSFTEGWGVEEAETYPRRLEALLRTKDPAHAYDVINLGVPGACTRDYLYHLREVGLQYKPDVVLVGLMANDVHNIYALQRYGHRSVQEVLSEVRTALVDSRPLWKRLPSRLWPALYEFLAVRVHGLAVPLPAARTSTDATDDQRPPPAAASVVPASKCRDVLLGMADRFQRRVEVEAMLAERAEETLGRVCPVLTGERDISSIEGRATYWTLTAWMVPLLFVDFVLLPPAYDAAWQEMTEELRQIDRLARGAGARTIVAFIPAAHQVTPEAWRVMEAYGVQSDERTLTDSTYIDRLKSFCAAANITLIDLLEPARFQTTRPLYFPDDGHWTSEGHQLAASILADALLQR